MEKDLTLEEMVNLSGLSLRTIRFYMQEGLISGPDSRGKNARYTQKHLDRLELIQRFKYLHLPLQEIRQLLNNMTSDEVEVLLNSQDLLKGNVGEKQESAKLKSTITDKGISALDYIRNLEEEQASVQGLKRTNQTLYRYNSRPIKPTQPQPSSSQVNQGNKDKETWQRIVIQEGIELNFKIPSTHDEEVKIDKLIAFINQLFKKK